MLLVRDNHQDKGVANTNKTTVVTAANSRLSQTGSSEIPCIALFLLTDKTKRLPYRFVTN